MALRRHRHSRRLFRSLFGTQGISAASIAEPTANVFKRGGRLVDAIFLIGAKT